MHHLAKAVLGPCGLNGALPRQLVVNRELHERCFERISEAKLIKCFVNENNAIFEQKFFFVVVFYRVRVDMESGAMETFKFFLQSWINLIEVGDSEKDDDRDDEANEDCDEDNTQYREVPIVEEESVGGDDGITEECMDGFEWCQTKFDDEYFTDSKLEPEQVRIAKLVKGNLFKRMVDGIISFHIGQIFNSKEHMREIFKEYAIQEGIELKRVKNDRVRQTYRCTGDGCEWRAHGSCMIDGVTFMLKTLKDQHDCHRVYNNKEAKVKWIAFKFEKLVKSNHNVDVKVIGDLLRENYKVSIEIQRLYKAKHRALNELANEHDNCKNLTFMSDRQKGVITALELHFPFTHRRYCARHIYVNFKQTYKEAMEEIGISKPVAKKWLEEIDSQHWSRFAYDPVIRCDYVTNNMIEAFNSMIGSHRAVSYLDLLEFIRRMVMRKFNKRKKECRVGNMEYELLGPTGGYAVKLREYNCQCSSWKVSGIPCCHDMAAINHYYGRAAMKDKVTEFVHSSLTKSAYLQTYVGMLHPILDQKMWPEVPACIMIPGISELMNPPPRTVQPGRLKKKRKREPDESPKVGRSCTVICKLCHQVGHNKRSCQRRDDNQVFEVWRCEERSTSPKKDLTSSSLREADQLLNRMEELISHRTPTFDGRVDHLLQSRGRSNPPPVKPMKDLTLLEEDLPSSNVRG
ncbi:hypothetical protein EZV62_022270 [Acer yangbiense]|uniref:SWIM-type domain-containing protein n=1 Tax=Acer yangbiense TaxID=1000413 RepID=A0A5C7H823_9ROSI|nr:hypothetical protein EZV62_022270 [Acer yangbiense]